MLIFTILFVLLFSHAFHVLFMRFMFCSCASCFVHALHVLFMHFMFFIYFVYGDEHVCFCQINYFDFDFNFDS